MNSTRVYFLFFESASCELISGCHPVLQVEGGRQTPETWTTGELSATQTASSCLLATSRMTSMKMSSKISS